MFKYIALLLMTIMACTQKQEQQAAAPQKSACVITDGKYPVQNITYNKSKDHYELLVLDAPTCWKQPTVIDGAKLGRATEGEKEKALIIVEKGKAEKILLSQDYRLKVVESVVENGKEKTSEPTSWAPFISGAAGGLVGGIVGNVIADKLSNKNNQEDRSKQELTSKEFNSEKPRDSSFFKSKNNGNDTKIYQKGTRRAKNTNNGFFKKKRR